MDLLQYEGSYFVVGYILRWLISVVCKLRVLALTFCVLRSAFCSISAIRTSIRRTIG